ncbi:MAG TPA: rhomboid family intramembrane serine protease [Longimicrobiaceae bacterium]|nr:rhomboid family intramembrane serine protease [Longimicrobiaceae bacterium]
MLPIRDENPTVIRPGVTIALIALNVAIWVLVQGAGSEQALQASVDVFGTVPCELTGACTAQGLTWSTVITSMFMHGGWQHIIGNMVFLWVFGNNVEDVMGHTRFLVFYLVCGIAADAAHVLLSPGSAVPTVGASGAISGVMGAYILLYPHARVQTWVPPIFIWRLKAWMLLGYWFLLQVFGGLVQVGAEAGDQGGVAVWAHVGGFVAGLALIKLFENPELIARHRAMYGSGPDGPVAPARW